MRDKFEVLQKYFGYTEFRTGQEELIDGILAGRDVLGIMPTGSGKSLCYQVPGLLLEGVTLVVSPLISLMKDQVAALKNAGVAAAYINSSLTPAQIRTALKRCRMGAYQIIYVAPERLLTWEFQDTVKQMQIAMVTVDEAHCISQWGQDFRPSYLRIPEFLDSLPRRPVVSAFTATATEQVAEDICRALQMQEPLRLVTGYDRPNLCFQVKKPTNKPKALLQLVEERKGRSGIIYCSTRKDTDKICGLLQDQGIAATEYHAGLPEEDRHRNQDDFLYDVCPVMVATNAFGMGIDKPNVRFVIHYHMPKSLESYYQEAGRAGRDGDPADCILLYAPQDVSIARYLIENGNENPELTSQQLAQIRNQDLRRLDAMVRYCTTEGCLRSTILSYFGEDAPDICESCGNCRGKYEKVDITPESKVLLAAISAAEARGAEALPLSTLIRLLQGFPVPQILSLGLQELPFYGRFRNSGSSRLHAIADAMAQDGVLTLEGPKQLVHGTDAAQEVLQGLRTVTMLQKKQQTEPAVEVESPLLMDALRELRKHLAEKSGIPPETVFSEASLREMAKKQPRTLSEFKKISGVGEIRASWYGKDFIALIKKYVR